MTLYFCMSGNVRKEKKRSFQGFDHPLAYGYTALLTTLMPSAKFCTLLLFVLQTDVLF